MSIAEVLREDHEELRRQVAGLEQVMATACSCGPFRQRCRALASILSAHIARVQAALAACGERARAGSRSLPDHRDEVELLHDVERLADDNRCPAYALALHLIPVIQALRAHMRQEEDEWFPLVDQIEQGGERDVEEP
jgi:hypothetical protein